MKRFGTGLRFSACVLLALISASLSCKRDTAPWYVLKVYETPDWAGELGQIVVKTANPDSNILLMRLRPDAGELFGFTEVVRDYDSGEVIYRYDPHVEPDELEIVDLRTWDDATGPEWWGIQQERRVPSKMRVVLITGKLNYKANEVPIEGDTVLQLLRSMARRSDRVAILSAQSRTNSMDGSIDESEPLFKKFYHQVYDMKKLELWGKPVPLPFESEQDEPSGVWAGNDDYVVYSDMNHKKVYIVDTAAALDW